MKMSDNDIQRWNQSLVSVLTPSIVIFIVYIVIGVIGNATVLIVYRTHKMVGNGRFFIPILAVVDLLGCIVGYSCIVIKYLNIVRFFSDMLCKFFIFCIFFIVYVSVFLVSAIAFDRYRRICQIGKKQFTRRQKWIIMTLILVLSLVCNIPILATSGVVTVSLTSEDSNKTIQGATCVVSKHFYPNFERIYSIVSGCSALVTFIGVTVFNINIAYVVCRKLRLSIKRFPVQPGNDAKEMTEENVTSTSRSGAPVEEEQITRVQTIMGDNSDTGTSSDMTSPNINNGVNYKKSANAIASALKKRCIPNKVKGKPAIADVSSKNQQEIRRLNDESPGTAGSGNVTSGRRKFLREVYRNQSVSIHVMFLVMFIVMLLAYLPPLTFTLLSYNNWELNVLWINKEREIIVNLFFQFRNSNLLSNVANPYIYSLFDRKFRSVLFKCVKCHK